MANFFSMGGQDVETTYDPTAVAWAKELMDASRQEIPLQALLQALLTGDMSVLGEALGAPGMQLAGPAALELLGTGRQPLYSTGRTAAIRQEAAQAGLMKFMSEIEKAKQSRQQLATQAVTAQKPATTLMNRDPGLGGSIIKALIPSMAGGVANIAGGALKDVWGAIGGPEAWGKFIGGWGGGNAPNTNPYLSGWNPFIEVPNLEGYTSPFGSGEDYGYGYTPGQQDWGSYSYTPTTTPSYQVNMDPSASWNPFDIGGGSPSATDYAQPYSLSNNLIQDWY